MRIALNSFYTSTTDIGQPKIEHVNQPILTVLDYIDNHIPTFINLNKTGLNLKNERGLTQTLIRILNTNLDDSYPFFFDKEAMQDISSGNSPAVDIEVIAKMPLKINFRNIIPQESFFALEAKILGVEKKHRLKEYVVGFDENHNPKICGGIERFKKGIYLKELPFVGIIGYILRYDSNYWLNQVNVWINELIENPSNNNFWQEQDKLQPKESAIINVSKYSSISKRVLQNKEINPVSIFHLWIDLQ